METHTWSVSDHYHHDDIAGRIVDALRQAGKDVDHLTIDDLAPADEVHTRGREATVELAGLTGITPDLEVLDVGCGIGGPARYLAQTFGCRVTGLDLTPAFCTAAARLTELVGLSERVTFQEGSALDMPFASGRFDLAWTMQMQMNIADKPALYREIARVVKPGGRFVFQDIVRGEGGDIHLPVPWARVPEHSHLVFQGDLKAAIKAAGFAEIVWRDTTDAHLAWTQREAEREGGPKPVIGIHLVLGADMSERRRNSIRNLKEGRIRYVQGVFRKPG